MQDLQYALVEVERSPIGSHHRGSHPKLLSQIEAPRHAAGTLLDSQNRKRARRFLELATRVHPPKNKRRWLLLTEKGNLHHPVERIDLDASWWRGARDALRSLARRISRGHEGT